MNKQPFSSDIYPTCRDIILCVCVCYRCADGASTHGTIRTSVHSEPGSVQPSLLSHRVLRRREDYQGLFK